MTIKYSTAEYADQKYDMMERINNLFKRGFYEKGGCMRTILSQRKIKAALVLIALLISTLIAIQGGYMKMLADELYPDGKAMVANLVNNGDAYTGGSQDAPKVPKYEKFELTFDIKYPDGTDPNANPYWPYDPSPTANTAAHPEAVPAGAGISVDGLFLAPGKTDWAQAVVQPAFYYQDYERNDKLYEWYKRDWLYPKGNPLWKVRFAPTQEGNWQYKIRVTDATGRVVYNPATEGKPSSFSTVAGTSRGFVQNSPTDYRYFQTSDGNYLNLVGLSDATSQTLDMDKLYPKYKENKINLIRPWWQGSQGPILFGISGQGGIPGWGGVQLTGENTKPGQVFSGIIKTDPNNPSQVVSTGANVKPGKTYKFSVSVKTDNLTGTDGFGLGLSVFPDYKTARDGLTTDDLTPTKLTGTHDWTTLSGTFQTTGSPVGGPDQWTVDFLNLYAKNMTGGTIYYTDFSVKEDLGSGNFGPELINFSNFNAHQSVQQKMAWIADYQTESAKANDIYLKVVLEEKQDAVFSRIGEDGKFSEASDNNVYANPTHASRVYQEYYWRYITARYGYSTAIQSWEFVNEGDPFNGAHTNAVQAMAQYFQANDPNRHLASTSNWHSYPSKEMWQDAPTTGYTDWHQYVGLQTGTDLQYYLGWKRESWGLGDGDGSSRNAFALSDTEYHSAPNSFYVNNTTGLDQRGESYPVAITGGHDYTVKYWIKARNLSRADEYHTPTMTWTLKSGWWGSDAMPWGMSSSAADFDKKDWSNWREESFTISAPPNAKYLSLMPSTYYVKGEVWFDDITIHDDTANINLDVPNGNFDSARLDHDSALINYSMGTQVGGKTNRVIEKPAIRGEVGISGNKIYGDTYKDLGYVGQNQQLTDDTTGVWYKKAVWSQINPYGVIDLWWWRDNIEKNNLYHYSKAYQNFMTDIPLSNGNYDNIRSTVSNPNIRAWGQKDLINNKAHLWIDNVKSNWKNVVDGVAIPPTNGTVTISGLKDGNYTVEHWDTSSGLINSKEELSSSGGALALTVSNLASDEAVKIYPAAGGAPAPADTTPPSAPSDVKLTAHSLGSMSFSWSPSTDNVGVKGYLLFMDGTEKSNTAETTATVNDITCYNCGITVTVAAYDAAGNYSDESTNLYVISDSPPDTTAPTSPANLTPGTITTDSISFTWSTSTDDKGVDGYKIFRNGAQVSSSSLASYNDTGLSPDTAYVYAVSAYDVAGNESAKSSTISPKTLPLADVTPPSIPSGLTLVSKSTTSANISWIASTDNIGVAGYKVFRNSVQVGAATTSSYTDANLSPNTAYSYSISAFDAAGNNSDKSTLLSVTTDNIRTQGNTELDVQVISASNYIKNATVSIVSNGQVLQTAVYNNRMAYYVFPKYVQKGAIYSVRISAPGYYTRTVDVNTSDATLKYGSKTTYVKFVRVTMSKTSYLYNFWTTTLNLFK